MKTFFLIILCNLFVVLSMQAQQTPKIELGELYIGNELFDINGRAFRLEDFRGKYILLGFWSQSSNESIADFKQLKKLKEQHADKLTIASICVDKIDNWKTSFKQKEITWYNLSNGTQKKEGIAKDFYIEKLPTYILIAPDGTYYARLVSAALYIANWENLPMP
ncbi:MAG: redoxin domain-containing protein [Bacteroides sp.]|nr:redoxin domain-containing protein [Bacteroides sp.]